MAWSRTRLSGAWWALRLALGLGMLAAGVDKFFDLLATWSMYLSPTVERLLPVPAETFLRAVGVMEVLLGILILSRWTRLGAFLTALWLVAIAVNLAIAGSFWDLALRDLLIGVSSFTLGRLTEWHDAVARSRVGRGEANVARPIAVAH